MAAMRSLWQSMSADMRDQLEGLLGAAFNDPGLQQAMNDLAETLGQLMPTDGYDHGMSGDEPLTLAEALGLMDEMNQISDMEDTVRSARNSDDLESLDRDQVERLAGPSARQALDELRRMTELLEEAGLIRKDGERYELTPRGIRKIGQRSLEGLFATLEKDAFGGHRFNARRPPTPHVERVRLRHEHAARVRDRAHPALAVARKEQADHPHHRRRADRVLRAGGHVSPVQLPADEAHVRGDATRGGPLHARKHHDQYLHARPRSLPRRLRQSDVENKQWARLLRGA